MRKIISILLAVLVIMSFAACNQQEYGATAIASPNPTNIATATASPDSNDGMPTTAVPNPTGTTPVVGSPAPTGDGNKQPAGKIKTDVLYGEVYYEFAWEETDSSKGTLTVTEYRIATADQTASAGLSGSITFKEEIRTYNVSYTKSKDGVYVAEGAVASVAASVEGESAATFIQMMKATLDDSNYAVLIGRVLDGEVLTSKEDIEGYIYEFDSMAKVTFTVENGKMVVSEFEKNYTSWGFMAPSKEILHIENEVVRSSEEYENNELVRIEYYRENGVIEKEDYYFEGEISSTTLYDENGDEIYDEND